MLARVTLQGSQRTTYDRDQEQFEQLELITSGVAHDFNNLLTSILGQSSLALKQLPADNLARHHIEKAMKAAEIAALLTRQLLTYARNGQSETQTVSLNQLVEDNAGLLKTVFAEGTVLHLELDPSLPQITARPGHIQQVVMNLIINAAEAISSCSGTVTVRTGRLQNLPGRNGRSAPVPLNGHNGHNGRNGHNGYGGYGGHRRSYEYVYLQVSDSGTGMDEATMDRMFDPFFTTKPNGRGVGLSAVRDIIDEYKGEITVESRPDDGTTITVFFPYFPDGRMYPGSIH